MFLNRGQLVDLVVVRVSLVVHRHDAVHRLFTQFFKDVQPNMAVQQNVLLGATSVRIDDKGLDDADFPDGGDNPFVLLDCGWPGQSFFKGRMLLQREWQ